MKKILNCLNMKKIHPLQILTWDDAPTSHLSQVKALLEAQAEWIQLRQKSGSFEEKLKVAKEAVALCNQNQAILIINDDPFLCLESGAHGVHLGLSDLPITEARRILGPEAIIGGTANTPEQVVQRMEDHADYVGLGPFRSTETKKNLSPVLGIDGIKAIASLVQSRKEKGLYTCPFVVIGGITPLDLPLIKSAGANGVAICSAIVSAPSISDAVKQFSW